MENELNLEERLARELGWLQNLARSLIRDPGVADDVVQEVLLGTLQGGELGPASTLRRDLFGRLKTRASNKRREAGRRRVREQRYAEDSAPDARAGDAARIVGEADTADFLMREVMALPESHRAILLLCYFEGRPQREIAAALGVTDEAVRMRLSRARGALRKRLDESSSRGREGWLAAVCVLAERSPAAQVSLWSPLWTFVLGWSGMKMAMGAALAALIGILTLALWPTESVAPAGIERVAARASDDSGADSGLDALSAARPAAAERQAAPVPQQMAPVEQRLMADMLPYGEERSVTGRVVEAVEGRANAPLEGAVVRVLAATTFEGIARDADHPVISAETDALGVFKVAFPSFYDGVLEVTCPGKVRTYTMLYGLDPGDGPGDPQWLDMELDEDIVLVEGRSVAGLVVNSDGQPIPGVDIQAFWPGGYEVYSFDDSHWGVHVPPLATTGADGRFEVRHRVDASGELVFRHSSYLTKLAAPGQEQQPLRVTMRGGASISGVVDESAWVDAGSGGQQGHAGPLVVVAFTEEYESFCCQGPLDFARPDDAGRFSIGGLVPGQKYQVQVLSGATPLRLSEPRSMRIAAAGGTTDLHVPLRAGNDVSFLVVDEAGAPLGGDTGKALSVDAYFALEGSDDPGFLCSGLFRTPLLVERWHGGRVHLTRLVPSHPGERLCITLWSDGKERLTKWCGPFQGGESVDLGTIAMEPKQTSTKRAPRPSVDVTVVDSTGQPVPGALVEHYRHPMDVDASATAPLQLTPAQIADCRLQRGATAGDDGIATLSGLLPGTHVFRVASPPGWFRRSLSEPTGGDEPRGEGQGSAIVAVSGKGASTDRVMVEQPPLCQVHGTVSMEGHDVAGAAIAFAPRHDVVARSFSRKQSRKRMLGRAVNGAVLLDATGEFTAESVPMGEWLAVVSVPGIGMNFEFPVATRAPIVELELVLEYATARGVVLDSNAQPIEGALVTFWKGDDAFTECLYVTSNTMVSEGLSSVHHPRIHGRDGVLTAADGSYAIALPTARQSWSLVVQHDRFASRAVSGSAHDLTVDITMPTCTLMPCGEVQMLAGGRDDIMCVEITQVTGRRKPSPSDWVNHDYGGREGYVLYRVPAGEVRVTAIMDPHVGIDLGVVTVRPGERTLIEIDPKAEPVPLEPR